MIVVPWWYRQLSIFGSISPTASTGTALWLVDYRQWNSITADVSLSNFLAQGPAGIVGSRVGGLVSAVADFALDRRVAGARPVHHLGRLAPTPLGRPAAVVPVHGDALRRARCSSSRCTSRAAPSSTTAVGLGPYAYILALEGVAALVLAIARRRPAGTGPRDPAVLLGHRRPRGRLRAPLRTGRPGGLEGGRRARHGTRRRARPARRPRDRPPDVDRRGGFRYATGRGGVVSPDDPIDTIRDVAEAYDIRWLVLEHAGRARPWRRSWTETSGRTWIGPASSVPGGPATRHRRSRSTRSAFRPAAPADDLAAGPGREPPRGVAVGRRDLPRGGRGQGRGRQPDRLPQARGHRLLRGGGPQPASRAAAWCRMPCGATRPRRSSSPARPSRSGCRCRPSSTPSRWPSSERSFGAAQIASVLIGALVPVLAWRLAADVAAERRPPAPSGADAGPGHGTDLRGLPAARPAQRPARLDHALRGPRPGRLSADARIARDGSGPSTWRPARRPLGVLIGPAALTRNEAIWLGATWLVIGWRAGQLASSPSRALPPWSWRPGCCATGSSSAARCRARPWPTP